LRELITDSLLKILTSLAILQIEVRTSRNDHDKRRERAHP
jgi:hypothetical protein